jgi:hypothetical protein
MNYSPPYALFPDENIVTAWESQVSEAAETPWPLEALTHRDGELFPRFVTCYKQLRSLPRSVRRAVQHRLARSHEPTEILQEQLRRQPGRALQRKLAYSLAGAALLLALGQGAQAATITVTTNKPGINPDGKCSLIEAIINANDDAATHPDCAAGSGADTIVLPRRRTHTLTSVHQNFGSPGPTGLPVITSPITIQGNGAKIVRKKSAPPFRLIFVSFSGSTLTLQNVALSGADGGSSDNGGGVCNFGGTLTIENSAISGNSSGVSGGGVFNDGTLAIKNSTISGNSSGVSGGGVYNALSLTIENSTISGNSSGFGGGVFTFSLYGHSTATIENSTISGNSAYRGGGVYNAAFDLCDYYSCGHVGLSSLTITNSTISGNKARDGGGAFNIGYLSLVDSSISMNSATDAGGGLFNEGSLNTTNSTISGNQAPVGPDVFP